MLAVEQGHGSMAVVARFHPGLEVASLCQRAFAHRLRALTQVAERSRSIQENLRQQGRQQARQPHRLRGRHLFLQHAMATLQQRHGGCVMSQGQYREVMARHTEAYQALSLEEQMSYEAAARNEASRHAQERTAHQASLREMLAVLEARETSETTLTAGLNRLSNSRFTEPQLQLLNDKVQNKEASTQVLRKRALSMVSAPGALPMQMEAKLQEYLSSEPASTGSTLPGWSKILCRGRQHFQECVLQLQRAGEAQLSLLFLFAMQNPLQAHFLVLHVHRDSVNLDMPMSEFLKGPSPFAREYKVTETQTDLLALRRYKEAEIKVVAGAFWADDKIVSDCKAVLFKQYVSPWASEVQVDPQPQSPGQGEPVECTASRGSHLDPEFAFLLEQEAELHALSDPGTRPSAVPKKRARLALSEVDPEDADLDAAWQEFTSQQREWQASHTLSGQHFSSFLRGGRWTRLNLGVEVDSVAAHACTPLGVRFLKHWQLGKMVTFSFAKYGRELACFLADVWCSLQSKRAELWHDNPEAETMASLRLCDLDLPPELVQQVLAKGPNHPARLRLKELMGRVDF